MKLHWPSPCSKQRASCEGENQSQLLLQAVNKNSKTKKGNCISETPVNILLMLILQIKTDLLKINYFYLETFF